MEVGTVLTDVICSQGSVYLLCSFPVVVLKEKQKVVVMLKRFVKLPQPMSWSLKGASLCKALPVPKRLIHSPVGGSTVGEEELGTAVGTEVGCLLGWPVGNENGRVVGWPEGCRLGTADGCFVGATLG